MKQKQNKSDFDIRQLPNPPPQSGDDRFDAAMDHIRAFEIQQMSYQINCCDVCNERRIHSKMHSATTCQRCFRDKNSVKLFSFQNNMDPQIVPDELCDLSITEQQLICRISPSINVHMLKHGGIAANGHCVTFPQAIDEPCRIFPKLPSEINIIKVRKQGKNDTSKEFAVRRYRVQNALVWLRSNNPAYADITISEERLQMLPVNGELSDIHTVEFKDTATRSSDKGPAPDQTDPHTGDGATASGVLLPEPMVNIREKVQSVVEEVIGPEHTEVTVNKRNIATIPWPTRDNNPVSEFATKHFSTLAFPCLFPYANGDFHVNRPRTISSMSDWAEHLLWYRDGRFARHEFFKFIVHNMIIRKQALERSSYIVRQQLGEGHMTVNQLKEKLQIMK